jgi:preprotein translocase subunit SecB
MSDDNQPAATAAGDQAQQDQPQFVIHKVYLKDLSFESPASPVIFTEQVQPAMELHFQNTTAELGNNNYEVVLTATVTVKSGDRTLYLIEAKQAGIFGISGVPREQLAPILAAACPNVLLPFAREAISDIVTKGGFPQLLIAPVNFEMLYLQEMQRRQQQDEGSAAPTH